MRSPWPIGIGIALFLVVVVNLAVLWIALVHPVEIETSYQAGSR
jgi:hypothetical protein